MDINNYVTCSVVHALFSALYIVAAEVDIMFGGMWLGVWVVEAKQSLSTPLVIEGSSWAPGRLKFFSASDARKPQPSKDIYGDEPALNGKIELEFKPEAVAVFVQHVRSDKKYEVLLTGFKEATVDDLKEEINRTLWERLGIVSCLIRNRKVLEEQNTVRYMTKCIILSLSNYQRHSICSKVPIHFFNYRYITAVCLAML